MRRCPASSGDVLRPEFVNHFVRAISITFQSPITRRASRRSRRAQICITINRVNMWFLSPLWLVGLVPWGGITLWLLWGRFERAQVPYLELWRGAMEERPARPGLRKPPLALLFAIAALLLAILAAARPAFWGNGSGAAPLRVILDCGMTMSASSRGLPRFRSAVGLLADELARRTPRIPIQLLAVPGDAEKLTDAGDLTQAVGGIATSQLKTSAALNRAVVRSLRSGDDAIFVVSDQAVQSTDPRIVRIVPQGGIEDVGIALIAARELPAPQVMVRVLNQSSQTTSTLDVISAEQAHQSENSASAAWRLARLLFRAARAWRNDRSRAHRRGRFSRRRPRLARAGRAMARGRVADLPRSFDSTHDRRICQSAGPRPMVRRSFRLSGVRRTWPILSVESSLPGLSRRRPPKLVRSK